MKFGIFHSYRPCLLSVLLVAFVFLSAIAHAETQAEMFKKAQELHTAKSNESFDKSVLLAMRALLDLESAKLPSAVANAFQAYGQYRNSDKLDNLAIDDQVEQLKISSLGIKNIDAKASANVEGFKAGLSKIVDPSKERKGDTKFLYSPEATAISQEFEKKTGLKREDFYGVFHAFSQSDISPSDPEIVNKATARFNTFIEKIPNKKFKENVKKISKKIPLDYRTVAITKAVNSVVRVSESMVASFTGATSSDSKLTLQALNKTQAEIPNGGGATTDPAPATISEANEEFEKPVLAKGDHFVGVIAENLSQEKLKEIVDANLSTSGGAPMESAKIENAEEKSLFDRVSRKLRSIPMI